MEQLELFNDLPPVSVKPVEKDPELEARELTELTDLIEQHQHLWPGNIEMIIQSVFATARRQFWKRSRATLVEAMKELIPASPNKGRKYSNFSDLLYVQVTGLSASKFRKENNLPKKANIREHLTEDQLGQLIQYEELLKALLHFRTDYSEIKKIIEWLKPETGERNE